MVELGLELLILEAVHKPTELHISKVLGNAFGQWSSPFLSMGDTDPQWMSETVDSIKPYIYFAFPTNFIPKYKV